MGGSPRYATVSSRARWTRGGLLRSVRWTRRVRPGILRGAFAVLAALAIAASGVLLGPVPRALAAAGEPTTWIGPDTGGNWASPANWSNGVPVDGSTVVFDTPVVIEPINDDLIDGTFEFRPGSSGANLNSSHEYRLGRIVLSEGVSVRLGLRLLYGQVTIAMSDDSKLSLERQVVSDVMVESTKLVDGVGPRQADLTNAVIRVGDAAGNVGVFSMTGNVRLELNRSEGNLSRAFKTPIASESPLASATAGQLVWARGEQLKPDASLVLEDGLSMDLNGKTQTLNALGLLDGTATLGEGGRLLLAGTESGAGSLVALSEGTSVVSGGTIEFVGSEPARIGAAGGTFEVSSKLLGSSGAEIVLDGSTLVLGDACGLTGDLVVTGPGRLVATNGLGGTLHLPDDVEYVDGSHGDCVSTTVPPDPPHRVQAFALDDRIGASVSWQWPMALGTNPLLGFEVYRSADPAALGTKIADIPVSAGGNVFEYVDEWADDEYLEGWTTYYYRVTTVSTTSVSAPSAQVAVITLGEPTPPASVRVLGGSGKVKLTWTPSAATNVGGYRVYRSLDYAAPTEDDPWAGTEAPEWTTPFGTEEGRWELVGEVGPDTLELLDDLSGADQEETDTVATPAFPLERTWNYYVTAYADGFGESDPAVVVRGTPSSQLVLTMSIFQEVDAYPGTTAVFAADVSNLGDGATSADVTMRLLVPSAFPVSVLDPATGGWIPVATGTPADGDGDGIADWTCSVSTIGDARMLRCAYATGIAGLSTSAPLPFALDIPIDAALGTARLSTAVSGSNSSGELGTGSSKPFAFEIEAIQRAALEVGTAFDGTLSADPANPGLISVTLRNSGTATTVGPPTLVVDVPDGTRLGSGHGSDAWSCAQSAPGADVRCAANAGYLLGGALLPGAVAPELVVPLLTPDTLWSAGIREALPIGLTATAEDAYGTVSAEARLTGTPGLGAAPSLLVAVTVSDPAALPAGRSAFRPEVTNAGGDSRSAPLGFVLRLPSGVDLDLTAAPPGWDCAQTGTTVDCTSTTNRVLRPGATVVGPLLTTEPLPEALAAAGRWQVQAQAAHDGIVGEPVEALVEVAPLPVPASSSLTIQPRHTPLRGGQSSSATITLAGDPAAGPAAARSFAALLPDAVAATGVSVALQGFGATTVPEWGECRLLAAAAGPFPGAGDAVVCTTTMPVPQGASVAVEVAFETARHVEGELGFAAGFVTGSDSAAIVAALAAGGTGALLEPSTALVEGIAFLADAGAPQSVEPTVVVKGSGGDPEIVPTTVRLAGTVTGARSAPVAYCWVQLGGPAVTWVEGGGDAAVAPGADGLPAFPAGSPAECLAGGFTAGVDHWFGADATFLAPQARDGAEVSLRLLVTDGLVVADAVTTVTVSGAGNSVPVIEAVELLSHDGSSWVALPDLATPQAAGTPLRLRVTVSDADGDRVTLTPWLSAPKSAGVVFTALPESTPTVQLLEFVWPTAVTQLDLGLTATDGLTGPTGAPSTTSSTVSLGPVPTPTIDPVVPTPMYNLPITAPWRIAPGLDLEGWVANGPIDVEAGVFGVGTQIVHPLAIPRPDEPAPEGEPDADTLWAHDPLTLSRIHLTIVDTAPPGCAVAAEAPADAVILALRAVADIDWYGRDTVESNLRFDIEGCVVAGVGWNLTNAVPIARMDIKDVPKTLTFRDVSFYSSRTPGDGDAKERHEFVGTAQSQGADGPATMAVWVPGMDDPGYGATRFALWIETSMSDISLYYGDDGYLLYTPDELSSLSDIPGFRLDRGSDHDPDVCTGTPTRHEDIPVTAGFSAVASYRVDAGFCELVSGIGLRMAGTMPMITPITAVPRGTIYLSGGASTLFSDSSSGLEVQMTGVRLIYTPLMLQLISDGEVTLPNLLHVMSNGREGSPDDRSRLDVGIGVTFGTNYIKEHTFQAFIQKTGDPWLDAFGVPGLDVGDVILQGGITLERDIVSTSGAYQSWIDWAFRAEIVGLPLIIEQALGIVGDEPIVMSTRFSKQSPIWDWQLGIVDGNTFMKPLKVAGGEVADVIAIDGARLIVSPFGGTIGDRVYPWGVTLEFAMEVFGLDLDIAANADLWGVKMSADIGVGAWSIGGVTMTQARLAFALDGLDPMASFHFTAPRGSGGDGMVELLLSAEVGTGPPPDRFVPARAMTSTVVPSGAAPPDPGPAAPAASPPVRPFADGAADGYLLLDFSASLEDISIGGVATVHDVEIWSHRELPVELGLRVPPAAFAYGMSATVGIFGHEVSVIGAVDLDSTGLKGYDLVGASEPLHVGGTTITGVGCGDVSGILPDGAAPPAFPTNGPCLRVSVRPGTLDPVRLGLSGSLVVPGAGLEATFDGRVDGTGLAIPVASVQLTSAITAKITDAHFYYGPRVAAGLVTDTNAAGSPVVVSNGDFRMRGTANASLLGGFGARLDVDLGKIGASAWASAEAELALLRDVNAPIQSSVRLAGDFAKSGAGYAWSLSGVGSASIAGYRVTDIEFDMGQSPDDEWFTLAGDLRAGPVTAALTGELWWQDGLQFDLRGEASMRLFGSTLATATLSFQYVPSLKLVPGLPPRLEFGKPTLTASLQFGGDLAGLVRLSGSGTLSANGDFCVTGDAKIVEVKGTAKVCHQGGQWSGEARAEVWSGMYVAASLVSMDRFVAAAKVSLPTVKKGVNLTYLGVGLSGDFVVRDIFVTLGIASGPGSVCVSVDKKGKCAEAVTFSKAGLYVAGAAKFKVHGCAKAGTEKSCNNWTTNASFKLNPVKFCGSKSFKLIKRWTIGGCYEPPSRLYTT